MERENIWGPTQGTSMKRNCVALLNSIALFIKISVQTHLQEYAIRNSKHFHQKILQSILINRRINRIHYENNERPNFSFIAKRASHDILAEPIIYHLQLTPICRHDNG